MDSGRTRASTPLRVSSSSHAADDRTFICGGTLLSNRHFVTAAHCATRTNSETELDPTAFTVTFGSVDSLQGDRVLGRPTTTCTTSYDASEFDTDVAILTLSTAAPAAFEPLRLVEEAETALWQAGAAATIIGWGRTESGFAVAIPARGERPDAVRLVLRSGGWGSDFHRADDGVRGRRVEGLLRGRLRWSADGQRQRLPDPRRAHVMGRPRLRHTGPARGLRAPRRAGAQHWVRQRVPMARASVSNSSPEPGEPVTFSVATQHPTNPGFFTNFVWDFDSDGTPDDTGATVSHAYPTASPFVARVRATGAGPDVATAKVAVGVTAPPPPPPPPPLPPAPVVTPPVAAPRIPLATILASGRPKVRRGRFNLRINFATTAPPGIAVIEVFRGKRKIGSGRGRVRRGGSRQVSVKLTTTGRRLLRRSKTKRLRVKVQVRVGRRVLRSRGLTIRR